MDNPISIAFQVRSEKIAATTRAIKHPDYSFTLPEILSMQSGVIPPPDKVVRASKALGNNPTAQAIFNYLSGV